MSAKRRALLCFLWLAVIGTAAAIFAFSAQTGDASGAMSGHVTEALLRLFARGYDALPEAEQSALLSRCQVFVRKGAHFSEFALLAFWLTLLLRQYGARHFGRWAWALASLYAVTDEAHQLFVAGRGGLAGDVLIDSAGALFGALLACALAGRKNRRKNKKAAPDARPGGEE